MTSFDLLELMWISTAGKTTSGVFLSVSKISLERKTHDFPLKIEKMKSFMSVLGLALAGEEVPGQNGWHVGCRVPARNPAFAFMDEGAEFSLFLNKKTSKTKKREFLVKTENNLEKVIYISLLSKYLAMIMFIESVILTDLKLDVIPMLSRQCLRVSSHGQMLFSVFQTRLWMMVTSGTP